MNKPKQLFLTKQQIRNNTIVSLSVLLLFFIGLILGWNKLYKQPKDHGAIAPLRRVLETNEKIFKSTLSDKQLTKTFQLPDAVNNVRVNGKIGVRNDADTLNWKLKVIRNPGDTLILTMADILSLPKTEIIFDFKCVEGWSQVTHWGGVSFNDFIKKFNLTSQTNFEYVGLSTTDKAYYVGIDMKSMTHPQTLLCYQMNGKPLPLNQGYPLRLIIPVKYGIKHIKRIGNIYFSKTPPPDYWYEKGYDYFAGL